MLNLLTYGIYLDARRLKISPTTTTFPLSTSRSDWRLRTCVFDKQVDDIEFVTPARKSHSPYISSET